jgi:predicted nucleic acid-binding protein
VVTIGELRRGATLLAQGSSRRRQLEHYIEIKIPLLFGRRVLPVTQAIGERWGVLDARRQAAGQPLGIADGMIAATAIEHDLTLVTRNVKDFAGLGVILFNPWEQQLAGTFRSIPAGLQSQFFDGSAFFLKIFEGVFLEHALGLQEAVHLDTGQTEYVAWLYLVDAAGPEFFEANASRARRGRSPAAITLPTGSSGI